jgi:ADP-dependent NAD(P)H-hydrate dehydratase / NAD(P)H-hydrate epimerase
VKIVTAAEMGAIDRATSEQHGVASLTLMENAGAAVADFAREHWPSANRIVVVCGRGNNGGDGLVAARRLHEARKVVEVLLLGPAEGLKPDAAAMLARLPLRPIVVGGPEISGEHLRCLAGAELILDAIFGTGYTQRPDPSPAQKLAEALIAAINATSAPVLSVDLPSGCDADQGAQVSAQMGVGPGAPSADAHATACRAPICRSSAVVTFTAPKPVHMLVPLTRGPMVVAPIGTPEAAILSQQQLYAVTPQQVSALFAARALESNKGRYGHVLVAAGSLGKSGAAAMCGMGALRIGAGLATVATPASVVPVVAGYSPEMMTEPLGEKGADFAAPSDAAHCLELAKSRNVLAVGPGLSQRHGVAEFVHRVVKGAHCPVVLDADGLNAFAGLHGPLNGNHHPLILTPHPGEMARLTGQSVAEVQADRVGVARSFARRHRAILVLKGSRTIIAYPDGNIWAVATGNPGMATGGTGDVLTGMIAGAIAQFPGQLEEAVRAAVYLHGLAGDAAVEHTGEESLVATDLLRCVPVAFRKVRQRARGKNVRLR